MLSEIKKKICLEQFSKLDVESRDNLIKAICRHRLSTFSIHKVLKSVIVSIFIEYQKLEFSTIPN